MILNCRCTGVVRLRMSAEVITRLLDIISVHSLGGRAVAVQTLSTTSHILSFRSVFCAFRLVRQLATVWRLSLFTVVRFLLAITLVVQVKQSVDSVRNV